MRKILLLIALVVFAANATAQAPNKMSYQAIFRNSENELVRNQQIGLQISICQYSTDGPQLYTEVQKTTSNENGLVTIAIGEGFSGGDNFNDIDWSDGPYFLKIEADLSGGGSYVFMGINQLLSVPYALCAKTAQNVKTYSIGDFAQGGIVFWLDDTKQHGLVCTKEDQANNVRWYAGNFGYTTEGDGLFSGEMNTILIIAKYAVIGDDHSTYAAQISNELLITQDGNTYGDWYLPSKEELNLLYMRKSVINKTAAANGGSALTYGWYWSSTEQSYYNAWMQSFSNGVQNYLNKSYEYCVRSIRAF